MRRVVLVAVVLLGASAPCAVAAPVTMLVVCSPDPLLADTVARAVRIELPGASVESNAACAASAVQAQAVIAVAHDPKSAGQVDVALSWQGGARHTSVALPFDAAGGGGSGRRVAQWVATEIALPEDEPAADPGVGEGGDAPTATAAVEATSAPTALPLEVRAGAVAATAQGGSYGFGAALGMRAGPGEALAYADLLAAQGDPPTSSQVAGLEYSYAPWGGERWHVALAGGAQIAHVASSGESETPIAGWAGGPAAGIEATLRIAGILSLYTAVHGGLFLGSPALPRWAAGMSAGLTVTW